MLIHLIQYHTSLSFVNGSPPLLLEGILKMPEGTPPCQRAGDWIRRWSTKKGNHSYMFWRKISSYGIQAYDLRWYIRSLVSTTPFLFIKKSPFLILDVWRNHYFLKIINLIIRGNLYSHQSSYFLYPSDTYANSYIVFANWSELNTNLLIRMTLSEVRTDPNILQIDYRSFITNWFNFCSSIQSSTITNIFGTVFRRIKRIRQLELAD